MNRVVLAIGVSLSCVCAASAAELPNYPTTGIAYNTKEMSSLTYECGLDGQELDCKFVQTSVRRESTPEDEANLRKQFASDKMDLPDAKQCQEFAEMQSMAEGKTPTPTGKPLSSGERAYVAEFAESMLRLCKSPTRENYKALGEVAIRKDQRTCRVASNSFGQRFSSVRDAKTGRTTWVVKSGSPQGACGLVNLSRFESDLKEEKHLYWNYIARKAVTNPAGEAFPGVKCGQLDEDTYEYSWRTEEHYANCAFINFGGL